MGVVSDWVPQVYKGIALFTPGGDLVYAIDEQKRQRWHVQLCGVLQELLGLTEPPHFLVPCCTATIDCWIDRQDGRMHRAAELYPMARRFQPLLNAVFQTAGLQWSVLASPTGACDPEVMTMYRSRFPELWQSHELVVRLGQQREEEAPVRPLWGGEAIAFGPTQGYVFRLFVSGHNTITEQILQNLHHTLERSLRRPYTLKIVDVHKYPDIAEANHITATPTLVRVWPRPVKRIVGDLDSVGRILQDMASTW